MKEGRTSAKLKGGPATPTTKLMEVLMNAAVIIMQEDSQLTEHELVQILQIALSNARVLLTKKLELSEFALNRYRIRLLKNDEQNVYKFRT